MPLTHSGLETLHHMQQEYGGKKGKSVFYASINAHKPDSQKWEGKEKKGLASL